MYIWTTYQVIYESDEFARINSILPLSITTMMTKIIYYVLEPTNEEEDKFDDPNYEWENTGKLNTYILKAEYVGDVRAEEVGNLNMVSVHH